MRPRSVLQVWLLACESQNEQKPVTTFLNWLLLSMKQCQRERTFECSSYQTKFRPPSLFQEKMSCGNWTPLKRGTLPVESDGKWGTFWEAESGAVKNSGNWRVPPRRRKQGLTQKPNARRGTCIRSPGWSYRISESMQFHYNSGSSLLQMSIFIVVILSLLHVLYPYPYLYLGCPTG